MINNTVRTIFIVVILFAFSNIIIAQSAGSLSDSQLTQIIAAANQRGMTPQEVAVMAKSKGYSDSDISKLMQRANNIGGKSSGGNSQSSTSIASQRQLVQFGTNDIMNSGSDTVISLTEEEKKIFGFEVFHNNGISFTPNLNMATPKDYVVGPGDELIVQIYGIAEATINLKVSPEGKVFIPNVGVSHVGGLSIEAVKSLLTQKIGTRYAGLGGSKPSSFLMVTLSNIRTINVNIVGDIKIPGTYQLPSFTNTFNALYAAGGPTVKGSFRNIQVFRGGKQIAEVDLYDFLLRGKTDKNIRLEDNDVLLVPQYGKRVEIVGEVRRNLLFEVKEKETVVNLIEMANGFTQQAYRKILTIQRYNGTDKTILNLDETEQNKTNLVDKDLIIVGKGLQTYQNRIQIIGSVNREGDYELKSKYKINDLIADAGGLKSDAFKNRAILYRTGNELQRTSLSIDLNKALANDSLNNIFLQREDLLVISSIYDIKENYFVSIQGEVNQIGTFPYSKGMTVSELILRAQGFKEAASGSSIEIVRRVRDNNNEIAKIIKVDINKDLTIESNEKNIILEPFDQVYVRASIGFRDLKKVYVQGEAKFSGQFVMDKQNMTVGELLKRAGGVLNSANVNGALLIRRTIFFKKESDQNDYLNKILELRSRMEDSTKSGFVESNKISLQMIDKEVNDLLLKNKNNGKFSDIGGLVKLDSLSVTSQDSVRKAQRGKSEKEAIDELKTALQARVFKNLKDVKVNDDQYQFVSINLGKIINSNEPTKYDLQLQEGDILYIPTYNETVVVSGDVLYPVAVKYNEETTLNNYVNQAGGFNNTALRKRAYVVEANGSVKRTRKFLWFKFYPSVGPGSMVFVPKNMKPTSSFSIDRLLGLTSSLVTTFLLIKNLK